MAEITIDQLIKIIVGVAVVVVVVLGIYLFFKNNIISFFKNIFSSEEINLVLSLFK